MTPWRGNKVCLSHLPAHAGNGCTCYRQTVLKMVLQQVHHFKVDVIAGDANAAAYKRYKKQEYQDLQNSSVAVMLRETQREVNTGRPFESRLHVDYSTNDQSSQLRAADDLDCCLMAIFLWRKPAGPIIMRKLWSNLREVRSRNETFGSQLVSSRSFKAS